MTFQRFMDMRYQGQWRSLPAAVGAPIETLGPAIEEFHKEHGREHNYRRDDVPVEIYRLSLRAIGVTPKPEIARRAVTGGARPDPVDVRPVLFDESPDRMDTPIYRRDDLSPGFEIDGPAIIDQLDSTTLVPPGCHARVDEWMNIRIDILEA
jgi:N-methylhydantoinase A